MSNVYKIARKEFTDLASNRFIVIVIAVYLFIMAIDLFNHFDYMSNSNYSGYSLTNYLSFFMAVLTDYGSIVAIIVGFYLISVEKQSNTINTLLIKPLYRDTVINGKLIGAIAFFLFILSMSSFVYTAGLIVVFGNQFGPILVDFIIRLPVVVLLALIYIMVFFSVSMLMSLLIRSDIFALFLSLFFWFIFIQIIPNVIFCGNLSLVIAGGFTFEQKQISDFIGLLSPDMIRYKILSDMPDFLDIFTNYPFEIVKLFIYSLVVTVVSYIVFLRSDIA